MKESLALDALSTELLRQHDAKIDYLVAPDRIHFASAGGSSEVDLLDRGGPPVAVGLILNDQAHDQFADRLGIPQRFYDRLRAEVPELLDANVNRLLRHHPKGEPSPWMIRTLDGVARAALSDRYRRIDNEDIASALLPVITESGLRVRSAHISDTYMYIKAVTPRVRGEVRVGQDVCAGVMIRNSEVGAGKFVIAPFVETLQCENGMTIMRKGDGMIDQIHLGGQVSADRLGRVLSTETRVAQDRAFMMVARDVVRMAVDEARFSELVGEMSRAAKDDPVRDVKAAVEVLAKRESLTEGEGRSVLQFLAEGGDLSRWGLISAVTRAAEVADSYDRATELEALGGKVLGYGSRSWSELAYAGDS